MTGALTQFYLYSDTAAMDVQTFHTHKQTSDKRIYFRTAISEDKGLCRTDFSPNIIKNKINFLISIVNRLTKPEFILENRISVFLISCI